MLENNVVKSICGLRIDLVYVDYSCANVNWFTALGNEGKDKPGVKPKRLG